MLKSRHNKAVNPSGGSGGFSNPSSLTAAGLPWSLSVASLISAEEMLLIAKTLIWVVVLASLFAACWVAYSTYELERALNEIALRGRYGIPQETSKHVVLRHDTYAIMGVGRWWQFRVYPRTWAAALIIAGAFLLIVGLVAILHIPHTHSA